MAVTVEFKKAGLEVYTPKHPSVKNCVFEYNPNEDREDSQYSKDWDAKCDAELLDAIATVGERNGQNANDFMHLFPAILRMLKSNSYWAK
jgi:hypothetical protein